MTTTAPHELKQYGDLHGEITLIENPDPFNPRYEIWISRVDWNEWRRLLATDDFSEAQLAFRKAVFEL